MTTNERSLSKLSIATAPKSLPPLEPPPPPHFPTLEEVVQLASEEVYQRPARRALGLFDGLLGDPTPMLEDFSRHPERYGAEGHDLLGRLLSGSTSLKQLSDEERRILDLATFDFMQNPQPQGQTKQAQALKPMTSSVETPKELRAKLEKQKPRPGVDVPVTELPAYWWL